MRASGRDAARAGEVSDEIDPRAGGIDDPLAFDVAFLPGEVIAQDDAADAALGGANGEDGGVIASDGSGGAGVTQPVGHQALGELALRVLIGIEGPALSGVERGAQGFDPGAKVAGGNPPSLR